jgi:hypothetical protein
MEAMRYAVAMLIGFPGLRPGSNSRASAKLINFSCSMPTVRLRSATSILDLLINRREHKEFSDRLSALEQRSIDVDFEVDPGGEPGDGDEFLALAGKVAGRTG